MEIFSLKSAKPTPTFHVVSKAYARQGEIRARIEQFFEGWRKLVEGINTNESEENSKNLIRDFLKDVWYQHYYVNTKERADLVIHKEEKASSPVGVIFETKRPQNKAEFPTQKGDEHNLNCKALYELLYYYLKFHAGAEKQVCNLVITNGYQWYFFDESDWAELILSNKKLRSDFEYYEKHKSSEAFYIEVAKPFFEGINVALPFAFVDLLALSKQFEGKEIEDIPLKSQREITLIYKLFSPQHLLKQTFQNTSNQLDNGFYRELLHILGLTEVLDKENQRTIITRLPVGERHIGSLLENTIRRLEAEHLIDNVGDDYGKEREDKLFNIAIELVITWLNRILFLKLLEAQLVQYHQGLGGPSFNFLSPDRIEDYDQLNDLFFHILAIKHEDRKPDQAEWSHIPYLNSSLFETTDLEKKTLRISNLFNLQHLPLFAGTVLKDDSGRRLVAPNGLQSLKYLLRFLDAYNFASEGVGDIQNQNKSLISAKVLGLFFEKINGYKDGSIYTPGYITEYMCRVSIRELILNKFNEQFPEINASTWDELRNWADKSTHRNEIRNKANSLINELKICDPAVGSGHFLVSALNEIIACKAELGILGDAERTVAVNIEVSEDELIITNKYGEIIQYKANSIREELRIQKILFKEKQTLIENCLFGVDINPNSVKICRLRLWIELLKNAYYEQGRLQTLPNIDINIKEGNSLIYRFGVNAEALNGNYKSNIQTYRVLVNAYKKVTDKNAKNEIVAEISNIVKNLREPLAKTDSRLTKRKNLENELYNLSLPKFLEEKLNPKQQAEQNKKITVLSERIKAINEELLYETHAVAYRKAFEWRFAFPEVLDEDGNFIGFDLVVGNPPYIRQEELGDLKKALEKKYEVFTPTADIYQYFFELGLNLCRPNGQMNFIVANKWMLASYGEQLRRYLANRKVMELVDFGDLPVFDSATTYPCIVRVKPVIPEDDHEIAVNRVRTLAHKKELFNFLTLTRTYTVQSKLKLEGWNLSSPKVQAVLEKIKAAGTPLGEFVGDKIFRGVLTGYNEAFVIDQETKDKIIALDPKSAEVIKPFLAGRDIKRYKKPEANKYLLFFPKGITKQNNGNENWLAEAYPVVAAHLENFKRRATKRSDQGDYWWELRACDYYDAFEGPKIIYPNILKNPEFTFDVNGLYANAKCYVIDSTDFSLIAILNSRVTSFLFDQLLPRLRGDYFEPRSNIFSKFPIPKMDKKTKGILIQIVESVFEAQSQNQDTSALEAEIDQIVFSLYGLTEADVAIIEEQLAL